MSDPSAAEFTSAAEFRGKKSNNSAGEKDNHQPKVSSFFKIVKTKIFVRVEPGFLQGVFF